MGTALSQGNKNKGLSPPGSDHLVGDTRHALNIYSIFFSQQATLQKKLMNVYRVSLEYKISVANTALEYDVLLGIYR